MDRALRGQYLRTFLNKCLDRVYNIETHGVVRLESLGLGNAERTHYAPSSWWTMKTIAKSVALSGEDVFVEFGSGKGRVVFLAARDYPFKRVIGVEISSELNEIAQRNIDRNRRRLRCKNVTLVTSDALRYKIPDDMTIAYFYSPFTGGVFAQVLGAIEQSFYGHPRRLYVVLQRPKKSPKSMIYDRCDEMLRNRSYLRPVSISVGAASVTTVYVADVRSAGTATFTAIR